MNEPTQKRTHTAEYVMNERSTEITGVPAMGDHW
jgi:hypothetical protein